MSMQTQAMNLIQKYCTEADISNYTEAVNESNYPNFPTFWAGHILRNYTDYMTFRDLRQMVIQLLPFHGGDTELCLVFMHAIGQIKTRVPFGKYYALIKSHYGVNPGTFDTCAHEHKFGNYQSRMTRIRDSWLSRIIASSRPWTVYMYLGNESLRKRVLRHVIIQDDLATFKCIFERCEIDASDLMEYLQLIANTQSIAAEYQHLLHLLQLMQLPTEL